MRVSFPLMLIVSLSMHVCVAGGFVLSHFHLFTFTASPPSKPPQIDMVLQPEPPAIRPVNLPAAKTPATPSPVTQALAATVAAPPARIAKVVAPAPALARENNPNAHVKVLPPEAALSPVTPPHLDGANGVVFVLDISGSMYEPFAGSTRLAFARESMSNRIRSLKDGTPFAIVLYAQRAYVSGPLVAASNETREAATRFIMRDIDCGGGTNLPAGLFAAKQLHAGNVVVVTDGDLNMPGYVLCAALHDILGRPGQSPALTIVGIAPRIKAGDDQLLQNLSDRQGGTYVVEQIESEAPLITSAETAAKSAAQ